MVLARRFPFEPCWVLLSDTRHHVPDVLHHVWHVGCCDVTEPCNRCPTLWILLRLRRHLVSDALALSFHLISISLVMIAMAYCSHTSTLAGGSGCTVHRPTPMSSKDSSAKVGHSVVCPTCICTDGIFSGWAFSAHLRSHRICDNHPTCGSDMPRLPELVHQQ